MQVARVKSRNKTVSTDPDHVPVTRKMLYLVRDELKYDSGSLEKKMDAGFKEVDARFKEIDARFDRVDSELASIRSEVTRIAILVEDQNAKNNIVLEGLSSLFHRQDRVEKRMDWHEDVIKRLTKALPSNI